MACFVLLRRCLQIANFGECPKGEVRRIPIPRNSVNEDKRRESITLSSACASLKADMSAIRIVRVMLVENLHQHDPRNTRSTSIADLLHAAGPQDVEAAALAKLQIAGTS
jgi:hypothetical protein